MGSSITRLQQEDQRYEPLQHAPANLSVPSENNGEPTMQDGDSYLESAASYIQEPELDLDTSPDTLADGSLNYFAGVTQYVVVTRE